MDIGTIFSTILFIGPGFYIRMLEDDLFPNSNRFDKNERYFVKAFIDSFFILIINLFILKSLSKYNFFDFKYFVSKFEIINFFIKYVFLTFITCCVYACFIKRIARFLRRLLRNSYNGSKFGNAIRETVGNISDKIYKHLNLKVIETQFPTIWDSIIHDYNNNFYGKIVAIEKDGQIISCGYIGELTGINTETKELKLVTTKEIQECMNSKDFMENYIETIEFEYFDFETGILIKCYKLINDALEKYVNRIEDKEFQTNE